MKTKKTKKILLIEDDAPIALAYKSGLTRAGFELHHIKNGIGALKIIEEIKPDLILLDLIMPKRDGFEVLADIEKHKELKHIPVMILSNLEDGFYTVNIRKYKVAAQLTKSQYSVDELIKKINGVLMLKS